MSSSISQYLRSGLILYSQSPQYDDKGRQLPFQESPPQRRERHAFVKSLQWQRNVVNWMHDQRCPSATPDVHSSSTSSSESSSPRTPASPLNLPHTHPDSYTMHEQRMKLQSPEALEAELQKLILASRQIRPPQHRQSRNYKNLHLPNTTAFRYQPQGRVTTSSASQPQRVQVPASTPTRTSIFDSPSYPNSVLSSVYPPLHHTNATDEELANGEPYILYSSSSSLSTPTSRSNSSSPNTATTKHPAAGIGEFPYPAPSSLLRSSSHSRSLSSPLTSPSSSSSPRTLTSLASYSNAGPTSPKPRVGDH